MALVSASTVLERGANRLTLRNSEGGRPLRPQDVEANRTVAVDVRVVDARGERHLRRLERVVCWEVNGQEKHSALVWTVWL